MSWIPSSYWNTFLSCLPGLCATLASPLLHWLLLLCPLHWHFLLYISKCWTVSVLDPRSSQFSSVQLLSRVRLFETPWITAHQASLSITNSRSLPKPMCIESVMPSSHLILCRPLLFLPPIPPSISLFQWVNSSHEVAKVLEFQLQHQSFQWSPSQDWFPLGWTGWMSLQSKGLSRVFSNTTVQKHQFFGTQLFSPSNSHIHTWLLEKLD